MDDASGYTVRNVSWIKPYYMETCQKNRGHLEIVKFLYSVGKKCTTLAIDHAASGGHLEVLLYR
jgi:peptide methionine sulfoxide reductase MsrA